MAIDSYIICTNPRSGSTLLCDLLSASGVAGQPDSYFRPQSRDDWRAEFALPLLEHQSPVLFDAAFIDGAIACGRQDGAIFGLRLMYDSLAPLRDALQARYPAATGDTALLNAAFGQIHYIHLTRQDKLAQAVSHARAEQTGLWHRHADGRERERLAPPQSPHYDHSLIDHYLQLMSRHDEAWHSWFAAEDIKPFTLTYEALAADPAASLGELLAALGLDPAPAKLVRPQTRRLADATSAEWIAKYTAETGRR